MTQAQANKDWAISLSSILAHDYGYNTDHTHPNPNWSNSQAISSPDGTNLVLNGTNEYILAPNNESLNFSGAITLSTWLYRSDNGNDWRNVFTKGDSFIAELDPSGNLRFRGDNNDVRFNYENVVNIPKDQWVNLAITLDEQGGTTIYLNGDSVFQAQDPQGDVINQSSKGIAIGFLENQSPYNPDIWMGGIDDVQIWDKALSSQQVKDWIYNKTGLSSDEYQQESSTHQLAHYEMNESSGNILHDSSGKGNNAAVKKGVPAEFTASAEDIQTDASGNVYIAGNSRAVSAEHPWMYWGENLGPYVSKFSSDGTEVWTKTFQDPDVYLSSGHYGSPLDVSDNGTVALAINERLDYQQSSGEYFNVNSNSSGNKAVLLKLDGLNGSTLKEYVLDSSASQAMTAISNTGDTFIVSGVDGGNQQYLSKYTDEGKSWEVPIGIIARDAYLLNDSVIVNGRVINQGGIIAEYSAESGDLLSTISRGAEVNAIDVSNGAIAVSGAEQLIGQAIGFVGLYDNQPQSNEGPKWVDTQTQNNQGWYEYLDVDFLENGNIVALGQRWWGPGAITEYDSDGNTLWNPDLYPLQNDYQRSYAPYEIEVGDGNIYFLGIDNENGQRWGSSLGSTSDLYTILDPKSPPNSTLNLLEGNDQDNDVVIYGNGSGILDGTSFSNIQSIDLKGGNDTAFFDAIGSLAGLLKGGTGDDTLNTKPGTINSTLNIVSDNTGNVDGTPFSNFETINLNAGNDIATISANVGTLNMGAGNDFITLNTGAAGIINADAGDDSVTVNSSSTALTINTGSGTDSLTSTTTTDSLTLSAVNAGNLGAINFTGVDNVTLGAGADTATIGSGGALSSLLNLGNGNDVLTIVAGGTLHDIQGGEGDDVAIIKDGGIFDNLDLGRGSDNINFEGVPQFKAVSGGFSDGGIDSIRLGNGAEYLNYLGFAEGRLYLDKQAGLSAFDSNSINYDPTAIYVGDFENFDFAGGDDQLNLRFDDSDITGRSQYPELFDTNTLSFSGGIGYDTLNLDASAPGLSDDAKQAIAAYQAAPAGNTLSVAFGGTNYNFTDFEEVVVNGVSRGPTFRISLSPTGTVNEGSDLTTTVQTTNLAEGTEIYWSAGGENINSSDFDTTGAGLSGKGTVDANAQFLITHKIAADSNTEGDEILQIKLFSDSARTTQVGSTASVTINGDNDNPMVVNDTIAVTEDQAISFNPAANDIDPDQGDEVRVGAVIYPSTNKGIVSGASGNVVTYSAINHFESLPAGGIAQETFSYTAVDNNGGSSPGTVTVNITGVNDAPVAVNDSIEVTEESNFTFNASENDEDIDQGDKITTVLVSNPTGNKGTAILNAQGQIEYKTNGAFDELPAGVKATESFSYVVADKLGIHDQGQVNVTVQGLNDDATITANPIDRGSTTQNASNLKLSESDVVGGKSAEGAFSISDVDYGEQEFNSASVTKTTQIIADGKGAFQSPGTSAGRVVGSYSLDSSSTPKDEGASTGESADLSITDRGGDDGFNSLAAGETATALITLTSEDGTATVDSRLSITGVNDTATITANAITTGSATQYASNLQLAESDVIGGKSEDDAFSISDVDYGEQEFDGDSVSQTVQIIADGKGAFQSPSTSAGHIVGSYSLDSSSTPKDAGATTGESADLSITDRGGDDGFNSLAAGETATALITLTSEDGTDTINSTLSITGVNDTATITANAITTGSATQYASNLQLAESDVIGGKSEDDAFSISDVDYGEQEFNSASVTKTTQIIADGKGAFQSPGTSAGRVVGSYSLDSSSTPKDEGASTGESADLSITDRGGDDGFNSLAAGETATALITLTSEDGTATVDSTLSITGVNDTATITANTINTGSTTQNPTNLQFTESDAVGGKSAENAFSISDVDYGEQEFALNNGKETCNILANKAGALQHNGSDSTSRIIGSFSLDASAAKNAVDTGANYGETVDLTITDNGSDAGFKSLAAGETATAFISLLSEDGTASTGSAITISGENDPSTVKSTDFKTDYSQDDFKNSPTITYTDRYQVSDIDYGEQEFSSGNYNTAITINSSGGRNGQSVGSFSIISDGSNRIGGSIHRDAGSQNSDSADVVISSDSKTQAGQIFNLAAVLDSDPSNNYGVTISGGIGTNGIYDLSDLSPSSSGHGQIEVYRYQTNGDGRIVGGGWSATDNNELSPTDPLRLIGGINSLAYGESATATLAGLSSEDGGASTGSTTVTISGANDAPVIDTIKQLKSFEFQGTFTVAEMLGFADPSKTLITDVDYGSMPESIAVTKLSPTGNFANAETGTLQRYNEKTKDWDDIDTKNVSDSNKLLLRPNDLLRFNATAEAYVSAALGDGSSNGGAIFAVEFRAWDSAYEAALEKNNTSPAANDKSLFSSDLQTINLAIASTGERANETDLTYIPGQAIGIDGSNITVDGELNIQTPVKGSVAGASSSVNDNAVALVDGTSFGGIHGVGSQNNITSAGSSIINAQAEGLVAVDASNYFDSFDDAIDADATARLGIKSGPLGSGLVANGAYGIRDVDLQIGGNLDLTGEILGKTNATSRSMDGRAHAGSQFSSSAGIANTTADVAGDMTMAAEGGILTNVSSFSRNGSAISDSSATAAYGVVSGLKGSETSFDVGGAFSGEAGLNITMNSKATMVGDGIDNNNGYSFDDEVVANNKIDKSIGLGTLDPQLHDLSINVQDTLELDINNTSLLNSEASAVTGDATAKGKMAGNTGIYHANLQAGGAGTIDVSIDSGVNSVAETTTGDSFASAYSLHSVGIESSDFDFQDPHSNLAIEIENNSSASASTKHGSAISHLGSSSAGMLGDTTSDFVRSVESVSALVNDHGFSQAAGISGTGAIATADQSATGIMGYTFTTTSALAMDVTNTVDSQSHSAIVQWG